MDLIGHEYGHHLAQHLGFTRFSWGDHYGDMDDCQSLDTQGERSASENGRNLAWIESWPTFFSIAAQKSFPELFRENIYTLGDDSYDAYNFENYSWDLLDLNFTDYAGGDACEYSVIRFLYQLWDGVSVGNESEENSEKELWADVYYASQNGNENFSQFYDYISNHHSSERMRELATLNKIVPSDFNDYSIAHLWRLVWNSGGISYAKDEDWNDTETQVESHRFRLEVDFGGDSEPLTLNSGNYIVDDNRYNLSEDEKEILSGETVWITIERQACSCEDGTVYSTFYSEPIEVTFPEYVKDTD